MKSLRAAVIGKDGRTSAIIEALRQSERTAGNNVEVLSGWKFSPFQATRYEEVRLNLRETPKEQSKTGSRGVRPGGALGGWKRGDRELVAA